jgi:hypothetical protein
MLEPSMPSATNLLLKNEIKTKGKEGAEEGQPSPPEEALDFSAKTKEGNCGTQQIIRKVETIFE